MEEKISELEKRLDTGDTRFETLEKNLAENTKATQQIAENTAGLVQLATDLQAGTKFLCRVAMGIRFVLEVVERFWKPVLIIFVVVYMLFEHRLPDWIAMLFKAVIG